MAEQVPWTEWEDITRLGGEVAEVEVKEHTPVRKKPGPKPKITSVMEAVRMHLGGDCESPRQTGSQAGTNGSSRPERPKHEAQGGTGQGWRRKIAEPFLKLRRRAVT